ncbi:hypothetical protein WJX72_005111 [[Myrmecia] bisecta]|uniref:sn-1-specific diacylglycerol lipase n=1 Tax=[Myrmecia] bisecta TaxID=41462 RepID=A0AAW1R7C1_9CHLO
MPALRIYGRRWHIATDVVPLPAACGAAFHFLWAIIFGALIGHYHMWKSCSGPGKEYIAATAGLMAVFVISFFAEVAMTWIGLQGTPLEVSRRRWIIPILYFQSFMWLAQIGLTVFGTWVVVHRRPLCWPEREQDDVQRILKTMITLTWIFTGLLGVCLFIVYNAYPDHTKERSWEARCRCLSAVFGCRQQMTQRASPDKAAPLSSIAQWISGLFGSIDLAPSDVTVALVLAAAAQRARRRMRIRRALEPKLEMLSNGATSITSSTAASTADLTELDDVSDAASDSDASSIASGIPKVQKMVRQKAQESGNLERGAGQAAQHAQRSSGGNREAHRKGQHARDPGLHDRDPDSARESPVRTISLSQISEDTLSQDNWGMPPSTEEVTRATGSRELEGDGGADGEGQGQRYSIDGVPLTRQISIKYPTVLTPTEQVDQVVGDMMDTKDAISHALGDRNRVSHATLAEASRFCRYALAVYAVKPLTETRCPCACPTACMCFGPTEIVTPESIRGDVLQLADIDGPDLLHFSHDNTALAHLPYMIVLDRPTRTVVVAIRGTVSIADLVTDAVVHPECINSWLPKGFRKKNRLRGRMYAHAGMVSAASAILEDLEAVGILPALMKDDQPNKAGAKGQPGSGTEAATRWSPGAGVQPGSQQEADKKQASDRRVAERAAHAPAGSKSDVQPGTGRDRSSDADPRAARRLGATTAGGMSGRHTNGQPYDTPFAGDDQQHEPRTDVTEDAAQPRQTDDHIAIDMPADAAADSRPAEQHSAAQRAQRSARGAAGDIEMGRISPDEEIRPGELEALSNAAPHTAPSATSRQTGHGGGTSDPELNQQQRQEGQEVGNIMKGVIDVKGWKLVLTGHSLGAGTAALVALKLRARFDDLHCWAFCPPGGLISQNLIPAMEQVCTSVVVGKDGVPRMSVNTLNRLMEEMVTALARCRYPKLQVIFGAWWRKANRPPSKDLFAAYHRIPLEARRVLERYHQSVDKKGRAMDMFPPGRIIFQRPIKTIGRKRRRMVPHRRMEKQWDAVWVTPREIIGEGILISKKMLTDHSLVDTVVPALRYTINHHPQNPKSASSKRRDEHKDEALADQAEELTGGVSGGLA